MYKEIRKQIDPNSWYKPSEIAEKGWILPIKGKEAKRKYDFITRMIRLKKLSAKDRSTGEICPHYVVKGSDILNFIKYL